MGSTLCSRRGVNEEVLKALEELVDKDLNITEIEQLVRAQKSRPSKSYVVDPRTTTDAMHKGLKYLFELIERGESCDICDREIPKALMSRRLSNGEFTFVTLDPYPFLDIDGSYNMKQGNPMLRGMDLVLWMTSAHGDVSDIPLEDLSNSLRLLGQIEGNILNGGYQSVQIYKNSSALTPHPGFGISATNKSPKRINDEASLGMREGRAFADQTLMDSEGFVVKDYESVSLFVPYLIRKPFDVYIIPKNTSKTRVKDLNDQEVSDLSRSLREVSYSLSLLMPALEKPFLYDLVFHTGPVGTMYIEVSSHSVTEDARALLRRYPVYGLPAEIAGVYKSFFQNFMGDYERGIKREPNPAMVQRVREECLGWK